jgi:hypothetical protein
MSVNAYFKCATAGAAWSAVAALWSSYVPHEDWSWSYTFGTGAFGPTNFLKVTVAIVKPDDTYNYNYIIVDTPIVSGGRGAGPVSYVISQPGWSTNAPPVLFTYGGRTSLDDYQTNVHPLKRDLVYACTNVAAATDWRFDGGGGYIGEVEYKTWGMLYLDFAGPVLALDQIMVDSNPEYPRIPDASLANPLQLGRPGCPSGGGSVDLAPVVAALQEIALIDVDYTANNGGTIFSMRGKVRAGP